MCVLSNSNFTYFRTFYGEGKHREETCITDSSPYCSQCRCVESTHPQWASMVDYGPNPYSFKESAGIPGGDQCLLGDLDSGVTIEPEPQAEEEEEEKIGGLVDGQITSRKSQGVTGHMMEPGGCPYRRLVHRIRRWTDLLKDRD
ncbi:jg6288 [Pararge aegeria aegeria]|uniref:Jg6288 protein n=1 Tax=Pararge aegeria aegeria TaxID=348720 RepID=A0A8S4SHR7_9NEOP|nr:jg6288 [Pararge aegeria aegeria]